MSYTPETVIGRFEIISLLGKGGMGEVYLAEDKDLDRRVAVKFLSREFSRDADKLNRFIREAKSASALNHPNIITIYEIGEYKGSRFIAAEFIEGETLNKKLGAESFNLKFVLDTAIQIASALDAAHTAGIIHRDVKPDNVMIRPDGLIKMLDFGIAKLTEKPQKEEIDPEDKTAIQVKTSPGVIIGTANYMSPEQAKGQTVDARTDVFSFGVVLYEMIAGHLPFDGETSMEIIAAIINKEPKPLDKQKVPPEIERIISKTLRKNRDERYQTIKGLLADLREVKQELEFQDKLEKTIQPEREEQKTQVLQATTVDEKQQTTTAENPDDGTTVIKSGLSKAFIGVFAFFLILAIGLGYWFYSNSTTEQIRSIAVMPFVNESGNEEIEYLADGMTETLINSLTNIPDLNVKARSSVFRYKGKAFNPKTIASELNVQVLLTGRIVQRGDQMTLNLELINPETENTVWGKKYERKSSELVTLQTEIARDVSNELKTKLSGSDKEKVAKAFTADPEAYKAYLKGRFHAGKRTAEGLKKGIEFFNESIVIDPNYALAWSGLADSYLLLPMYSSTPALDVVGKAKSAAKKAVELDPNLADAHNSLAFATQRYDWKFAEAEEIHRRAIELNPKNPRCHHWFAMLLITLGRSDEAVKELKTALELDPLSRVLNRDFGTVLIIAGRLDEAIVQQDKAIELDPDFALNYIDRGVVYELRKMYPEAAQNYIKGFESSKDRSPEFINEVKQRFEQGGWKEFDRYLADDGFRNEGMSDDPIGIALGYAQRGDIKNAMRFLNKAYEERHPTVPEIKVMPLLEPLYNDTEYKKLISKIG